MLHLSFSCCDFVSRDFFSLQFFDLYVVVTATREWRKNIAAKIAVRKLSSGKYLKNVAVPKTKNKFSLLGPRGSHLVRRFMLHDDWSLIAIACFFEAAKKTQEPIREL